MRQLPRGFPTLNRASLRGEASLLSLAVWPPWHRAGIVPTARRSALLMVSTGPLVVR